MSDVISIEKVNTLTADQVIKLQEALEERAYQLGINAYVSGKIYKFVNNITGEVLYVGSTKQELKQRKGGHLSFFKKCPDSAWTSHVMAIGGPTNIDMVLIELYPCRSKAELVEREAYWIRVLSPICNTKLRGPTADEDGDGNIVREQTCQAKKKSTEPSQSGKMVAILNTDDVIEEEFDEIHRRVLANCASANEKLIHGKHLYKVAWGIDRVDEEWVTKFGVNAGDLSVEMCLMFVSNDLVQKIEDGPRGALVKAQMASIREMFKIFGWLHPFDSGSQAPLEAAFPKLMKSEFFKEYNTRIKLFNRRAKPAKKVWKIEDMFRPVQTIMNSCGVKVKSTIIERIRTNGQNIHKYAYSIDHEASLELARLVNLRLRSISVVIDHEVLDYLNTIGYGSYARLINSGGSTDDDLSKS